MVCLYCDRQLNIALGWKCERCERIRNNLQNKKLLDDQKADEPTEVIEIKKSF